MALFGPVASDSHNHFGRPRPDYLGKSVPRGEPGRTPVSNRALADLERGLPLVSPYPAQAEPTDGRRRARCDY